MSGIVHGGMGAERTRGRADHMVGWWYRRDMQGSVQVEVGVVSGASEDAGDGGRVRRFQKSGCGGGGGLRAKREEEGGKLI